jgi:hypothetical protein
MKKFFLIFSLSIFVTCGTVELEPLEQDVSLEIPTTTTTSTTTTLAPSSTTTSTTTTLAPSTTTTSTTTTSTTTTLAPSTTTTLAPSTTTTSTTTTSTTTTSTTTTSTTTTSTTTTTTLAQPLSYDVSLLCYKDGEGAPGGWSGNYGVGITISVVSGPAYVDFYISAYGAIFSQSRRTVNDYDSIALIFGPDANPIVYYRVSNDENELNNLSYNSFPQLDLSEDC